MVLIVLYGEMDLQYALHSSAHYSDHTQSIFNLLVHKISFVVPNIHLVDNSIFFLLNWFDGGKWKCYSEQY